MRLLITTTLLLLPFLTIALPNPASSPDSPSPTPTSTPTSTLAPAAAFPDILEARHVENNPSKVMSYIISQVTHVNPIHVYTHPPTTSVTTSTGPDGMFYTESYTFVGYTNTYLHPREEAVTTGI